MSGGRPRTTIGAFGQIGLSAAPGGWTAATRVRDDDGRLRRVKATARSKGAAMQLLKERIRDRPAQAAAEFPVRTSFRDLVQAWLDEIQTRDLTPKTKQSYAEMVRGTVLPALGDLALGEITTRRVDALLRAQYRIGYDRARKTRTMLNLLFKFALRLDAIPRNPVDGASRPDPVEHDAEEYTIVRDGKVIARIVPASERTVGGFLARRAASPAIDDDFASDAVGAEHLLTTDIGTPWRD